MADLPPASLPPSAPFDRRPRRHWVMPVAIVAAVVLVAAGAWWIWGSSSSSTTASGTDNGKKAAADAKAGKGGGAGKGAGGRFGGDPNRVQPVAAVAARTGDINIIQTALGTATALRTVTVKPRVDGLLQSVTFNEGQLVKAGEMLAQIDPVPFQVALSQAEGQLARDAATLNNARLDLDRYQKLLAQDSIATQQVDQQASMVKQLEGTVKIDQAMVDNAKLQLSYTRITAPLAGRVGLRQVDPGNMVRGSDTNGIAVLTQVHPITVLFTIPQDTLQRLLQRLAAGEKPVVDALDRDQKTVLAQGSLVSVDNQIDLTTGTVKLKAEFANPTNKLFPNQFVNVRMVIDTLKGVVLVPSAAIQKNDQGTIVYVVKEDSTVTIRRITTGPTENDSTAVTTGLQAGERVIVDGVDRIREGQKVEVVDPSTPRPGGRAARGDKGGTPGAPADPAKREEFKKKLESMTPEQREEFKKRREERKALQ